jgi:SNF2 family DNA or RNA helicase
MLNRNKLHQYQQDIIQQASNIPCLGLLLPPGLGKTATTLTIIAEQCKGRTLIIAPKKVAESVWSEEIVKWEHTKHLRVSKILGNPKERVEAVQKDADVYIINLENVVWLTELKIPMTKFDNLVIDESSRFKDSSTKRFKAIKPFLKTFKRRIILTGTPTPQGYQDLWSQVAILDLGQRLETSLTKFRDKYMMPIERNRHTGVIYKWGIIPKADEVINDKIKDICFSLKAEDYLTLPEVTKIYHNVQVGEVTRRSYDKLRKDMVLEIEADTITAVTAAALSNKLLQFTSGSLYLEDGSWLKQHDAKLDYLEDLIDENIPTLVFYHYKSSLAGLQAKFPHARLLDSNPQTIEDWRQGKIKMLLAHPQSGGIGINLQCNVADTAQMVWYDLPWSSENYIQANARVHRQGQEKPVIIHHLVMYHSIDNHVIDVLEGKINIQNAVLNALNFALV